jgi:hypothetical protein
LNQALFTAELRHSYYNNYNSITELRGWVTSFQLSASNLLKSTTDRCLINDLLRQKAGKVNISGLFHSLKTGIYSVLWRGHA